MIRIVETKKRGCGVRKEHGLYAVAGEGGSEDGVLARFNRINPPVPYQVKFHRGPRIVDGDAILNRQPLETWWHGSSRETEEKKSGDQWAIETFGMTATKRLTVGECSGTSSLDEALAVLVGKVKWDNNIVRWFREMTLAKIQELPRVAVDYTALHQHLHSYAGAQKVGDLMGAQAAIWRMAYNIPPAKRSTFVPFLVRLLTLMNLGKDAAAMMRTFGGA